MACCHSLTQLNGQLAGDPMDMILFEKTGWRLEEAGTARRASLYPADSSQDDHSSISPSENREGDANDLMVVRSSDRQTRIRILREFSFTSSLRRMSVFVHLQRGGADTDSGLVLFCKGAPETISDLCSPDTVPEQFTNVLRSYAKCGYRVIALASKRLDSDINNAENYLKTPRLELEKDMTFLGFVIFENRLKDQTIPNIKILKNARLRTVMVTGDNMLTAVSVAKECGLLDDRRPIYTIEADLIDDRPTISLHPETHDNERLITSARRRAEEAIKQIMIDVDEPETKPRQRSGSIGDKKPHGLEASYQLAIGGQSLFL